MSDRLQVRLDAFAYHRPSPEVQAVMTRVRESFQAMASLLDGAIPESREKSLAFTALEESAMWAMKALSLTSLAGSWWTRHQERTRHADSAEHCDRCPGPHYGACRRGAADRAPGAAGPAILNDLIQSASLEQFVIYYMPPQVIPWPAGRGVLTWGPGGDIASPRPCSSGSRHHAMTLLWTSTGRWRCSASRSTAAWRIPPCRPIRCNW